MPYKTVVIDSLSELGRLAFSRAMNKRRDELEKIRELNHWPGSTERLNILVRRLKDFKEKGTEIVIIAHEQIERFYAKGSGMKNEEPFAVKGMPDIPGKQAPEEVCRAMDNVFRVRTVNNSLSWICKPEAMVGGAEWIAKDRFGAQRLQLAGVLPGSYEELVKLIKSNPAVANDFHPPYLWLLYGAPGLGKTRSLLTFPRPMLIHDIDRGTDSLKSGGKYPDGIEVKPYHSEEGADYMTFVSAVEASFK